MNNAKRFLCMIAVLALLTATVIGFTGCGLSGFKDQNDGYLYDDDVNNDKNGVSGILGTNKFETVNGVVVAKVETVDGELVITYTDGSVVNLGPIAGIEEAQGLEYYPLSDGTYGVKMGSSQYMEEITIPDTYRGTAVTQILPEAFKGAFYLRTVYIPDTIQIIGESAFSSCSNLYSITIPQNVTRIGADAFADCYNLYDVYVQNVETWMNVEFEDEDSCPGKYATVHLTDSYGEEIYNLKIPEGLSNISSYAFMGCRNLTSVTIPDSVSYIEAGAFRNCSGLTSVTFPGKITEIGEYAFADCYELTEISIPDAVEYIGRGAFSGCSGLISITLPFLGYSRYSMEYAYLGYIFGASEYSDSSNFVPSSLSEVKVTSSSEIGYRAFADCYYLTSITIPDTVSYIGNESFRNCSNLSSVTIPSSVTDIGEYAFADCNSLSEITVPDSVNNIGYSAFAGCYNLNSITLPFVGESIDGYYTNFGYIFGTMNSYENGSYVPSSLHTVVITGGSSIGYEAFRGCGNVSFITLPVGISNIGDNAFYECYNLTEMNIPDGVTGIGSLAFYDCSDMQFVTIPYSVSYIGDSAFSYCTGLTNLYYAGSEYDWEYNVSKGNDWNWQTNSFAITYNYIP